MNIKHGRMKTIDLFDSFQNYRLSNYQINFHSKKHFSKNKSGYSVSQCLPSSRALYLLTNTN